MLGLNIVKVSGYAKGYGYYQGKQFESTDHAWIAFQIDEATITVAGEEHPLEIPGESKIIKAQNLDWEISDNGRIELQIDLTKSVLRIGSKYHFIPRFGWRWRAI